MNSTSYSSIADPVAHASAAPGPPLAEEATPHQGLAGRWLAGWGALVFLVLNLLVFVVELVLTILLITGIASLPAAFVGVLIAAAALWGSYAWAFVERARISALLGVHLATPPIVEPRYRWMRAAGLTWTHWRAAAYTALHVLWSLLSGLLTVIALSVLAALAVAPFFIGHHPPEGLGLGFARLDSPWKISVCVVLGLLLFAVVPFLGQLVTSVDAAMARWLLGPDERAQMRRLNERVDTLTRSRVETVDSVEAERRRIERDLHDGPQQQLVSVAMELGMARAALDKDPHRARELLDRAHATSKQAITDMRHVARGITPPILTDRGLGAALSALAARSAVPVRVDAGGVGRLDPTVEAIAYFCVSEALTNVTKHAQAHSAAVRVNIGPLPGQHPQHSQHPQQSQHPRPREALFLTITDDGVGGAEVGGRDGTGLIGLRQRVSSVDGHLALSSPPGGPTSLAIVLPIGARS